MKSPLAAYSAAGGIIMLGEYPIYFAGEERGRATVTQQGMFWHIRCCCHCVSEAPCAIMVCWDENQSKDLGMCSREGKLWGLTTRLNRKNVPTGQPVFRMRIQHRQDLANMVPISAEEPFRYIASLKTAYLVRRENGFMVAFRDQSEMSKPTGQWSEPSICE